MGGTLQDIDEGGHDRRGSSDCYFPVSKSDSEALPKLHVIIYEEMSGCLSFFLIQKLLSFIKVSCRGTSKL